MLYARPGPRPGVRVCVCVSVYMCARACVCDQVSVFAGVRARAGVGALGERPENTLVCTERPFAAGEFVFFHFCSTFSQAASCLVSDHFKQQQQQPKKKKRKKERKRKRKKNLLFTSRLHVHLPQPSPEAASLSPGSGPGSGVGGGCEPPRGWRGFLGHRSPGCISRRQLGGGVAKAAARGPSRLPLGPFTRCSAVAVGREIDEPRRPGVTLVSVVGVPAG